MICRKKGASTKVEIFKGEEWVRIYSVKSIKRWDMVSINIGTKAFKAKTVGGLIRLLVGINGDDRDT